MKRWWLWGLCLGLLVLTGHVFAIKEPIGSIADVAGLMPDDTALYLVMRTDEQALKDVNALVSRVTDKLAILGVPSVDLEDELRKAVNESGGDYELVRAAFGDYIAVSMTAEAIANASRMTDSLPSGSQIYFQVRDADKMRELIEQDIHPIKREQGDYTIYTVNDITVALSDQWLIMMGDPQLPTLGRTLANTPAYQHVATRLPGSDYGALMFISRDVMKLTAQNSPANVRELAAQDVMLGFALDQGQNLVLDFVQTVPENNAVVGSLPTTPIDMSFLRHVPEDADFVIHLTDLADYVDYADAYVDLLAPGSNLRGELEKAFLSAGLNLNDDLLNWMGGEGVLYSSIDLEEIIDSNGTLTSVPFQFGLVVETSDAEASQRALTALTRQLKDASSSQLRIGNATVNNVKVTTLHLDIPNGNNKSLSYEIMLGVTDDVAFIASADTAQFITAGRGASLLDNDDYQAASALYLPNTKLLFYASDDGILSVGAAVAFLAAGDGFHLPGMSDASHAASPMIAYQTGAGTMIVNLLRDVIQNASVTSTMPAGFQITRLVFSLD